MYDILWTKIFVNNIDTFNMCRADMHKRISKFGTIANPGMVWFYFIYTYCDGKLVTITKLEMLCLDR